MTLDLKTDRRFQEKWWKVERLSWFVMLGIVLAAVAGLTGRGGPLASAETLAGDRKITYPRVARWQTSAEMSVEFPPGQGDKGEILLPSRFANLFSVESVTPQPASVRATPEGILFEFDLDSGPSPSRADFALRARKPSVWTHLSTRNPAAPSSMSFIILP